jgi:hypothetical protein
MIDFDVLPSHSAKGGLGLSCLQTPARNQCWPNKSATTWPPEATQPSILGTSPANLLPVVPTAGLMLPGQPPQYVGLMDLLREVFSLNCINTQPAFKRSSQPRSSPGLDPLVLDVHFSLLHDLLNVRATRHHLRIEDAHSLTSHPASDARLQHPQRPSSISSPPVRGCLLSGTSSSSRLSGFDPSIFRHRRI